jgi:hypothetical protein
MPGAKKQQPQTQQRKRAAQPHVATIAEMERGRAWIGLLLIILPFIAVGTAFIYRMGIEVDEAVTTIGLYPFPAPWYAWHLGSKTVPVMHLPYLGALKTWIYSAVLPIGGPSSLALRLPTFLLTAFSLWLFFKLLDETVSRRAAWIGILLLAADPMYLLLNAIDYGPVSLQFVLKLGALVLFVKFHRSGNTWTLAAAFLLLGLALWDKAIFMWVLAGLVIAAIAAVPREFIRHLSLRNIMIAAAAMLLGALPIIIYNVAHPFETFRSAPLAGDAHLWSKYLLLSKTLDGSILFGFYVALDPGQYAGNPANAFQMLAGAISQSLGQPHQNWILYALPIAALSLAITWNSPARRPIIFSLVAGVVTWLAMALTPDGGGGAHHALLIWPFPAMMIAAAIDQIPWRAGVVAVTAALVLSNSAVTNQYFVELIKNGPALRWTDAMDPLHRKLVDLHAPHVYSADWGIAETMNFLSKGTLEVHGVDIWSDKGFEAMVSDPSNVFVSHTPTYVIQPNLTKGLEELAQRGHYEKEPVTTIVDRNGRPTFDIFRFRKLHL